MALAYAVIFASTELFDRHRRDTVQEAQRAADQKFEAIAQQNRLTMVTRNPEPRVMTYPEMRNAFPGVNLDGIVGLYFTADIT
uniref:Minor tail protein n=1 Tax=Micrococcus phage Olihed TaxID=3092209 RepID=A0AAU6R5C9_9CAUD